MALHVTYAGPKLKLVVKSNEMFLLNVCEVANIESANNHDRMRRLVKIYDAIFRFAARNVYVKSYSR